MVRRITGEPNMEDVRRARKAFNGNKALTIKEAIEKLELLGATYGLDTLVMSQSWPVSNIQYLPKDHDDDIDIVEIEIDSRVPTRLGYDPDTDAMIP